MASKSSTVKVEYAKRDKKAWFHATVLPFHEKYRTAKKRRRKLSVIIYFCRISHIMYKCNCNAASTTDLTLNKNEIFSAVWKFT